MMKNLNEECVGFVNDMGHLYRYMPLSLFGKVEGLREGLKYLK